MKEIEEIVKCLNDLDWKDIEMVSFYTQKVLLELYSRRDVLRSLLESLLKNEELISLCEHYDFFDKLVLYKEKSDKFRIRLHVFLPESHKDRAHYHRWTYSSLILRGGYKHLIYGTEEQINEDVNPQDLKPLIVQEEKAGSIYTLNHNVIHSVEAVPYSVSLIIRGPAVKDRFLILDRKTGRKWWEYGRESEAIEEIRRKAMNVSRIKRIISKLYEWGVV
jgi:hypothetical protein